MPTCTSSSILLSPLGQGKGRARLGSLRPAAPHRSVRSTRTNILRPPNIPSILSPSLCLSPSPSRKFNHRREPSNLPSFLLPTRTLIENWNTTVTWGSG
jgi:hypothetical protein